MKQLRYSRPVDHTLSIKHLTSSAKSILEFDVDDIIISNDHMEEIKDLKKHWRTNF